MVSYASTIFNLINPATNVAAGIIQCYKGTPADDGAVPTDCSQICESDNSSYFLGAYSSSEGKNVALNFIFSPTSTNKYGPYLTFGQEIKIIVTHPNLVSNQKTYYLTSSSCGQNYPLTLTSNSNNALILKITTPPGRPALDGTPLTSTSNMALVNEYYGTYLYYNPTVTQGWIWATSDYSSSIGSAMGETSWISMIIQSTSCVAPDPHDPSMYYSNSAKIGDQNYGVILTGQIGKPSCPGGTKFWDWCSNIENGGGLCAADPVNMANPEFPYLCESEWKDQTSPIKNRVMCCSGLWAGSDRCHPYYCPSNSGSIPVYGEKNPTTCEEVMMEKCKPNNWVEPTKYESYACNNYIAVGDPGSARNVVINAVKKFYSENTPEAKDYFVRKAIDLCGQFPGACDDILLNACKNYTWSDLDPNNWLSNDRRKYDPNGTNLIDTCGCFLPDNQYVLSKEYNITKPCNTICGMPNAIKPGGNNGDFQQCGGATCVIDSVTFNSVDSSNGGFSINQACSESGTGPYICYLGNDIDLNGTGYGNVQIQQNCDVCYIFDPNDTSKPPTKVNCSSSLPPTPSPPEPIPQNWINILNASKSIKWVLLGAGILILIAIIIAFFVIK